MEIERKFLVAKPPIGWKKWPRSKILQGYLPVKNSQLEIRLRRKNSSRMMTVKCGHGLSRLEEEFEIPSAQFESLWRLTRGERIAKTRYIHQVAGGKIEMDVFAGPHRGLITAEMEFKSADESRLFQPPAWFGREITGSKRYGNRNLARRRSA